MPRLGERSRRLKKISRTHVTAAEYAALVGFLYGALQAAVAEVAGPEAAAQVAQSLASLFQASLDTCPAILSAPALLDRGRQLLAQLLERLPQVVAQDATCRAIFSAMGRRCGAAGARGQAAGNGA